MFVAGNFVPFQILMVPVRDLTLNLGLYNTKHWPRASSTSPSRPGSARSSCATSSARCPRADRGRAGRGRREWRIFWYIVLPLMRPAIAALSVLIFTFIWNDYFWAIVLTTRGRPSRSPRGSPRFNASTAPPTT
jgi:multiple sugar transport system permease protein